MADLNDMTFPDKLTGLAFYDGDDWSGGIDWLVSGTPGRTYTFGDVRKYLITNIFPTRVLNEERFFNLVRLLNNCVIKIGLKYTDDSTLNVTSYVYDKNDTYITTLNSLSFTEMISSFDPWDFSLSFFISTRYTGVPTEGITSPDEFGIYMLVPGMLRVGYDTPLISNGTTASTLAIIDDIRTATSIINATLNNMAVMTAASVEGYTTWLKSFGDPFNDPVLPQDKPAGSDDPSVPGGGGGTYDDTSDPIDFPALPTGGALTSGMIKGYVIGSAELQSMQQTLWNMSIFDIATQFQKLVNDPLQCLISLAALPVTPTVAATTEHVKLGSFDTGASAYKITNQYVVVDCGSLSLKEYWGSALDYAPYTDIEIFLPFCGMKTIRIEDAQALTLVLKYYVDVLTGSCVAFLKCGQSVLYTFTGNCLQHIPVTSQSSDLLKNSISAAGALGVGMMTGNPAAAASGAAYGAINTATSKNHVQRSGDLAGSAGILGDFTPYVIIHRPIQSLAKGYNQFKGYPCNITYTLSNLNGYTEVEHVHLTGISGATDAELEEIESLLKEGVII